jgi:hypothetical protein
MLSKQVKERIRKNKQRRVMCRKKAGRELQRAMRRARQHPSDFLNIWSPVNKNGRSFSFLKGIDKLIEQGLNEPIPTGFESIQRMLKGGGFKRGELPILIGRAVPQHERRTDFNGYLINKAMEMGKPIQISLEHEPFYDLEALPKPMPEFIIGLDPGAKEGDQSATKFMTIVRGKRRNPATGSIFDIKMDFSKVSLEDIGKAGDAQEIFTQREVDSRMAMLSEATVAPRMYKKPDGTMEVISYDLVNAQEPSDALHAVQVAQAAYARHMDSWVEQVKAPDAVEGKTFFTIDSFSEFEDKDANRP